MKNIFLLILFVIVLKNSIGQIEIPRPYRYYSGFRNLNIDSIKNETVFFSLDIYDKMDGVINGKIKDSKITFFIIKDKQGDLCSNCEKIIEGLKSEKTKFFFNGLSIDFSDYPDSSINTRILNLYLKPLKKLNYNKLECLSLKSKRKIEIDRFLMDSSFLGRGYWDSPYKSMFYSCIKQLEFKQNYNQEIDVSKLDFIKKINFKNLKLYSCEVPYFDSKVLISFISKCNEPVLKEFSNQTILSFDSLYIPALSIGYRPIFEFWNNSYKISTFQYTSNFDFPINYFFNYYLNPKSKDELFHKIYPFIEEKRSEEYVNKCTECSFYNYNTNEYYKEIKDSVITKGFVKAGKPTGKWSIRENVVSSFFTIDFDSIIESPKFPQNGTWVFNYDNGKTAIKGNFDDGKKTGTWCFYSFDGQLIMKKCFKNDILDGLSEFYTLDGQLESKWYFHSNGHIVLSINKYILTDGVRKLDGKYFLATVTNEEGSFCYDFFDNEKNDKSIHQKSFQWGGYERIIEENTEEYEQIMNTYFLKYLDAK